MTADPTLLGTVESVSGPTVSVALEPTAASGLTYVGGHGYRAGQVGNFVRIGIGLVDLFGLIGRIGAGAVPEAVSADQPHGHRWMTVELVGEALPGEPFRRGLSEYPTIGDKVYLLTEPDLVRLYGETDELRHIRIGMLAGGGTVAARLHLDRLITRHSAVVGATGSGKSTTVARLLSRITDSGRYPGGRALLFDLHGEYASAIGDQSTVFAATATPSATQEHLWVPFWALPLRALVDLTMGAIDERPMGALSELVLELKRKSLEKKPLAGIEVSTLTADSPVPFSLKQLWFTLHRREFATHTAAGTGQSDDTEALLKDGSGNVVEAGNPESVVPPRYEPQQAANIYLSGRGQQLRRQVDLLGQRLRDPRYAFLLRPGPFEPMLDGTVEHDLDELLSDWLGGTRPLGLLDLSAAPAAVLNALVGAIVNIVYEALLWSRGLPEGGRERPLLLVLEEAHAYLGRDDHGFAAEQIRRVVREGRKYGLGAMVVTQRPSQLDATVLSQCGTLIALRLANDSDRHHVTGAASDTFLGLLANLPILRTGEAIILGEAVGMPMRAQIDALDSSHRPDSHDPAVIGELPAPGGWTRPRPEKPEYESVVAAWRSQDPRGVGPRSTPSMERAPVMSSNLVSVGYDTVSETLEVEFTSSDVYQYSGVPEVVFEEFMGSPSLGTYFNANIARSYPYIRI